MEEHFEARNEGCGRIFESENKNSQRLETL
jgi:hypothetical protein